MSRLCDLTCGSPCYLRWPVVRIVVLSVVGVFMFSLLTRVRSNERTPRPAPLSAPLGAETLVGAVNSVEAMKALYNYLEHPQQCCRDLRPFGGTPGHSDGSKMVCMDAEVAPPSGSCLAYSFGVANDWSFDRAMYQHGCEVHSFDPSVNHTEGRTPFGPVFHRQGLSGDENTTREDGWIVMTLGDTLDSLGHGDRTLHYLKVDVEGAEWNWLDVEHEEVLNRVRQLAMEVHFLELQLFETEDDLFEVLDAYITSFELLRSLGFCLVSVSENPINPGRRVMPRWGEEKATLFEVLWVKR